jgi:glycosyltransferase involved in cell wall biosynthesis
MKNITIILPVHKLDDDYNLMLQNAVESAKEFYNDVKLMIVAPTTLKSTLEAVDLGKKLEIEYKYHTKNTDFCSQVNEGIDNCKTDWFSILEVDDEYQKIWLKSINQYIKENADVDVFLPIVKDVDEEGNFTNFTNESVWAYGFSEKQGMIDNEVLLEYQSYQISGGLYKTKVVKENGGFKENVKLTFGYEFLLRLTHNGAKIMVVPRIGYRHVNLREDSLFWLYKNDEKTKLAENEAKFWVETAKKEFFFTNKREVNYNGN